VQPGDFVEGDDLEETADVAGWVNDEGARGLGLTVSEIGPNHSRRRFVMLVFGAQSRRQKGVSRMSFLPELGEFDVDGAIREAAEKVDGDTRAAFLRKAGVGAGAVIGGGALFGALPAIAGARTRGMGVTKSDVAILNYALTLEYLEAAFYTEAVASGALKGKVATFARTVKGHEVADVTALKATLGSAAVKKPKFNFKGTMCSGRRRCWPRTSPIVMRRGLDVYGEEKLPSNA
jgi:hypothetical protein